MSMLILMVITTGDIVRDQWSMDGLAVRSQLGSAMILALGIGQSVGPAMGISPL